MGGRQRGGMVGLLVGAALGGGLHPGAAAAARYHVYACHTPDGLVAPIDGWTGSANGPDAYALDDCAGRLTHSLTAALDGSVSHEANTSNAIWEFDAAPGLRLAAAALYRHEALPGGVGDNSTYVTFFSTPSLAYDAADVFDNCQASLGCAAVGTGAAGFDAANRIDVPAGNVAGAAHLYMEAYCGGTNGQWCPASPGFAAEADIYAADLTLADDIPPVVGTVGGTLVSGARLTGFADVTFWASDQGSGVYSATLSLDGQPVASPVVDPNGGHCQPVGEAVDGLRDFRFQTPCRTSSAVDLPLDTSQIHDGQHALRVTVDDAAGNVTDVYSATITTHNAPQGGPPQVTGTLVQGQRLTVAPGSWSPTPGGFAYQWLRCDATPASCQAIPGAVGGDYVPGPADDYRRLAVDVTAYDAAGSTTSRSALVGPVADPSGNASGGSVHAQSGGLTAAGAPKGIPGAAGAGHLANGTGGCPSAHLSAGFAGGRSARVGLGRGATLHGALRCAGRPVAGAAIELSVARWGDGGPAATSELRSAADGSFAVALPPGPSRDLTLSYRAFADAPAPSATATARLEVVPSIGLSISPARVRNGQTITYRGQVAGGYIPASGLPLQVEYRDGRRWRTFDQTRARARDGRFVYRYTFRRTTIPIVYTFRVAIPRAGVTAYPYAPGASRARSVRVNP